MCYLYLSHYMPCDNVVDSADVATVVSATTSVVLLLMLRRILSSQHAVLQYSLQYCTANSN